MVFFRRPVLADSREVCWGYGMSAMIETGYGANMGCKMKLPAIVNDFSRIGMIFRYNSILFLWLFILFLVFTLPVFAGFDYRRELFGLMLFSMMMMLVFPLLAVYKVLGDKTQLSAWVRAIIAFFVLHIGLLIVGAVGGGIFQGALLDSIGDWFSWLYVAPEVPPSYTLYVAKSFLVFFALFLAASFFWSIVPAGVVLFFSIRENIAG